MPNSILPQDQDGQDLFNAISSFFCNFGIGNLLRKCNAQKEKGVPILDTFKYKLCNVFSDRSMYMQQKTGSFRESFSKNTFYRFLNSQRRTGYGLLPSCQRRWPIKSSRSLMMIGSTLSLLTIAFLKEQVVRKQNSVPVSLIILP